MIFATGDTHGGFQRFSREHFSQQEQMGRDDYMIICGDFGGVWNGSSEEQKRLDWLNDKPFTTLFVAGNHENFWMLRELPVEDWQVGKVQRVRPNILHLMRGQLYDIEGRSFFTMGGATSHDVEDSILDPEPRTSGCGTAAWSSGAGVGSASSESPGGRRSCPPMRNTPPHWTRWSGPTGRQTT